MTDELPSEESEAEARRPPPPVDWRHVRRVHVTGICGSGTGALAGMLQRLGLEVRGSDTGAYPPMSTWLADRGIPVMEGYDRANLEWGPDLVVVGNVVRPFNPEAVTARRRGLPQASMAQTLSALFLGDATPVVVAGTHGKTTTSSMTAWLLDRAGLEPGFFIGGVTGNFGSNHRLGARGAPFVVEGDEYDTAYFDKGPKFLHYRPEIAAVLNVEFDHADIYPDLEAIQGAFRRFVELLPATGRLVVPADDARVAGLAAHARARVWTFGPGPAGEDDPTPDVAAYEVTPEADGLHFVVAGPDGERAATRIPVWGDHNLRNALAAVALAHAAGAPLAPLAEALPAFELPRKRQELRGTADDVPVLDDFAHHPTAIRETLRAVRTRYPQRRILALFEVESNTSRRRVFQDAFGEALGGAERVWFCEPLAKDDGLPGSERLDLDELVEGLRRRGTPAERIPDVDELARAVAETARPGRDVIVAMSGRDFHGIHDRILAHLRGREEAAQ